MIKKDSKKYQSALVRGLLVEKKETGSIREQVPEPIEGYQAYFSEDLLKLCVQFEGGKFLQLVYELGEEDLKWYRLEDHSSKGGKRISRPL